MFVYNAQYSLAFCYLNIVESVISVKVHANFIKNICCFLQISECTQGEMALFHLMR